MRRFLLVAAAGRLSLGMLMVAIFVPRRRTTRVFDTPHAIPVGMNTTSGLDSSTATPRWAGPAQRVNGRHAPAPQRSSRNESAAISK